jgi:hypothetical protein
MSAAVGRWARSFRMEQAVYAFGQGRALASG